MSGTLGATIRKLDQVWQFRELDFVTRAGFRKIIGWIHSRGVLEDDTILYTISPGLT